MYANIIHIMTTSISRPVLGVKSGLYHAGLNMSVRKKTHRDFINDDIQVKLYKGEASDDELECSVIFLSANIQ